MRFIPQHRKEARRLRGNGTIKLLQAMGGIPSPTIQLTTHRQRQKWAIPIKYIIPRHLDIKAAATAPHWDQSQNVT
jgi:hypothetical protein